MFKFNNKTPKRCLWRQTKVATLRAEFKVGYPKEQLISNKTPTDTNLMIHSQPNMTFRHFLMGEI